MHAPDDVLGFAAASCMLLTFCTRSMSLLRLMAILSNLLFILYACRVGLLPVFLLHVLLLPINLAHLLLNSALQTCPPKPLSIPAQSRFADHAGTKGDTLDESHDIKRGAKDARAIWICRRGGH